MRIYTASSWRNGRYPLVVMALRDAGHEVFDFRDPSDGKIAFHWSEIDPEWQSWTPGAFREALLTHPYACRGFESDFGGMEWAEACVLVMPCGRSSHLEAGWFVGQGKPCFILLSEADFEPELMYRMATSLCASIDELLHDIGILNLEIWSDGRKGR